MVKKVGLLSLLLTVLMLGMFATSASAEGTEPDPIGGYNEEAPEKNLGNVLPNANATGVQDDRERITRNSAQGTSGIHGNYKDNTNTCATCHQTHTSQSKNLVFADTVYQSCIACHDGTAGGQNRNVLASGEQIVHGVGNNPVSRLPKFSGTFGGTYDGNMSVHLTTGAVKVSAAPGGDRSGDGYWGETFSCASCHNPHGSYSNAYLQHNPAGMAYKPVEDGGRALKDRPVVNSVDDQTDQFIFLRTTKEAQDLVGKGDPEINDIVVIMRDVPRQGYLRDESPWIHYQRSGYVSSFKDSEDNVVTGLTSVREHGFVEGSKAQLDKIASATVYRAYYVPFPMKDVTDDEGNVEQEVNRPGLWAGGAHMYGIQMSEFCSSCHVDYLVSSGGSTSNWDSSLEFYGHTTNNNSYTCVRCHFAHGTDVDIMMDAQGKTVWDLEDEGMSLEDARNYMMDVNPSSALKRFTNMSSCWACHNSSKNQSLTSNFDEGRPSGMPEGR